MKPKKPADGKCPHDAEREQCPLVCKYNHFESDDLTIDAWELKCLDCGWRDTVGYRSDEEEEERVDEEVDPTRCPFCQQAGLPVGRSPCEPRN